MHKWKISCLIIGMAICMFILVIYFGIEESPALIEGVRFYDSVCDMELKPWHDEAEDKYYLFLPAYVSTEELKVDYKNSIKINFSEGSENFGTDLEEIPVNADLSLTLTQFLQKEEYTFRILQTDSLPTVYIETESGSLDRIDEDKNNEETATVLIIGAEGSVDFSSACTITGRGNGTWGNPKNPYNLKFSYDINYGPFEDVDTLCLLAEYSDESKMRNGIAYYAGEQIGIPYASPYLYANVYINQEYHGLYGIATKKEYLQHIEEDGITAVFEIVSDKDSADFTTGMDKAIHVMYGDTDNVEERVSSLEDALQSQNWSACESLINLSSWAGKYAFEEFISNFDLIYASQYFYMDEDGVISCMLPWDYDLSLCSSVTFFNDIAETQIIAYRKYKDINCWYTLLLDDEAFVDQVSEILNQEYTAAFMEDLDAQIAQIAASITASRDCDAIRWQNAKPYSKWDVASGMETSEEFSAYFQDYLSSRIVFLREYFYHPEDYCMIEFYTNKNYLNLNIPKDAILSDYLGDAKILHLDRGKKYTFSGWKTEDGLVPGDIHEVEEDLSFLGSWEKK